MLHFDNLNPSDVTGQLSSETSIVQRPGSHKFQWSEGRSLESYKGALGFFPEYPRVYIGKYIGFPGSAQLCYPKLS